MMSIYANRMALTEKYKDTLAQIEVANPKKDGTTYDMSVCFDMLVADSKNVAEGKPIEFPFADSEKFDWATFASELEEL